MLIIVSWRLTPSLGLIQRLSFSIIFLVVIELLVSGVSTSILVARQRNELEMELEVLAILGHVTLFEALLDGLNLAMVSNFELFYLVMVLLV